MSERHSQLAGARPRGAGCFTALPERLTQPHSAGEQSGLGEGMSTGLAIGFGAVGPSPSVVQRGGKGQLEERRHDGKMSIYAEESPVYLLYFKVTPLGYQPGISRTLLWPVLNLIPAPMGTKNNSQQ